MTEILYVVKKIARLIEEKQARLTHLRNLMSAIVPDQDGMPKSTALKSKVEFLAASITDTENHLAELKAILIICRIELNEFLSARLPDPNVFFVIFYRYGLLKKFSEIAKLLNFSESSVFRLHKVGLQMLAFNF